MQKRSLRQVPVVLSIAGSDSGGGAGIQADLKTFAALGVHGTTVITCVTAQNPRRVTRVHPCPPQIVQAQLDALREELPPAVVKTGMLYSTQIIEAVADWLKQSPKQPLVVDPVMVATSRSALLQSSALHALKTKLLPLATLITPNLDETEVLSGCGAIRSIESMRQAAHQLNQELGCAILVKGGHLPGDREAADLLFDGKEEWLLTARFVPGVVTHGTGCTYSAAITAYLARSLSLVRSVSLAKEYVTEAIAGSYGIGRHSALAHGPF